MFQNQVGSDFVDYKKEYFTDDTHVSTHCIRHTLEIIHLNYDSINKLPHIYIPEIDARLMIDTGSTRSFIGPAKADEHFPAYKCNDPFKVISTHGRSLHGRSYIYFSSEKALGCNYTLPLFARSSPHK